MKKWFRGWRGIAVLIAVITLTVISGILFLRRPRLTAAARGHVLAQNMGCFGCHGPGGTVGAANPGALEKMVPPWDGGTAMMYINNENEIREWILYGAPGRLWKDGKKPAELRSIQKSTEKETSHQPLLYMPAYENLISESELEDLVAYFKAVAHYTRPPSEEAAEGYRIASGLGCFGCHGPGGEVGVENPGSFKGYIPPWEGEDYSELVHSEDELREWILEGKIKRLESNPIARYFTNRQIIQMPAYKQLLKDEELDALVAYINWLSER